MYSLINPPFMGNRTPPIIPLYEYAVKGLKGEVTKVVDYYQSSLFTVSNTHLIRRILVDVENYIALQPEALLNLIRNNEYRLCHAYGITSPTVNSGIIDHGYFYNRNNPEVFISTEYEIDPMKCYENYKLLKPVRVLSHDFTDINLHLPDGKYLSPKSGICVFGIDLAILAIQFKAWNDKERYIKEQDVYLPMHHFIAKYVITNMLSTHVDISIFNRLVEQIKGNEIITTSSHLPLAVLDFTDRIDHAHKGLINLMKRSPMDYLQRLNAIPAIDYGSYYRAITFPDMAPTRNVKWAMLLAKLNMVEFLMLTDKFRQENKSMSVSSREVFVRELRYSVNDKAFGNFLPQSALARIDNVLTNLSTRA